MHQVLLTHVGIVVRINKEQEGRKIIIRRYGVVGAFSGLHEQSELVCIRSTRVQELFW